MDIHNKVVNVVIKLQGCVDIEWESDKDSRHKGRLQDQDKDTQVFIIVVPEHVQVWFVFEVFISLSTILPIHKRQQKWKSVVLHNISIILLSMRLQQVKVFSWPLLLWVEWKHDDLDIQSLPTSSQEKLNKVLQV